MSERMCDSYSSPIPSGHAGYSVNNYDDLRISGGFLSLNVALLFVIALGFSF